MIKVFTLNKNNKIELTKKELEDILNEAYWDGYNTRSTWTYTTPISSPYCVSCNGSTTDSITIKASGSTTDSITLKASDLIGGK